MSRFARLLLVLVSFAMTVLSVLSSRASAVELYSTFGAGDSYNGVSGWTIDDVGLSVAAPFSFSQPFTISSFEVAMGLFAVGDPNADASISFALHEDSGSIPGSVLHSTSQTIDAGPDHVLGIDFTSFGDTLQANTTYWLSASLMPGELEPSESLGWNWNDQGVMGYANSLNSGASWNAQAADTPAFRVNGHPEVFDVSLGFDEIFLFSDPLDVTADAIPLDLSSVGIAPGDLLHIRRLGGFSYINELSDDTGFALLGVFSESSTLLPRNMLHRIPGAIDVGPDLDTGVTFGDGQPTDIPEDFVINEFFEEDSRGIVIEVPPGATHLFLGPFDSGYFNNGDENNNYGARIETIPELAADFDENGEVGGIDFLSWQRGFGTDAGTGNVAPLANGNANGDQFIDYLDLAIWENQYGTGGAPLSSAAAVPEPSTSTLLLLLLGSFLMRRQ